LSTELSSMRGRFLVMRFAIDCGVFTPTGAFIPLFPTGRIHHSCSYRMFSHLGVSILLSAPNLISNCIEALLTPLQFGGGRKLSVSGT
jgi:hypothetical protein